MFNNNLCALSPNFFRAGCGRSSLHPGDFFCFECGVLIYVKNMKKYTICARAVHVLIVT